MILQAIVVKEKEGRPIRIDLAKGVKVTSPEVRIATVEVKVVLGVNEKGILVNLEKREN